MSEANGFLSRDQIIGADDKVIERIEVPEWNGTIYLRVLSAHERDLFDASTRDSSGNFNRIDQAPKMLVRMICDSEGRLLLAQDDVDVLASKSSRALERLFDVALRINGYTEQADEAAQSKSSADPLSTSSTG